MNKGEVRDAFFEQLGPLLPGFLARKKRGIFVRKIPAGEQQVGLALIDYNPHFEVALLFNLRLAEVEKIVDQFAGGSSSDESITSATHIDYFAKGAPRRLRVATPSQITAAVQSVAPILETRVLPFFETHQDVQSLDATMNGPDGAVFDQTNAPYRQMSALTVAWLAGNPRFEELAAAAELQSRTEAWHPKSQAKLSALVKHLRERER